MIENGYYAVIRPANIYDGTAGIPDWANWWRNLPDHTGNDGAVLVVNAGAVRNQFYRRLAILEAGGIYRVTSAISAMNVLVTLRFEVQHPGTETALGNSPDFSQVNIDWEMHSWQFTVPATCAWTGQYAIAIRNQFSENFGNDLYIDDITLEKIGVDNTGGGNITCPTPSEADLVIAKTNNVDTVVAGGTSIYMLVVTNNGPAAADGATVHDPVTAGLDCTTATCGAEVNGAACPAATGAALATALQSGAGAEVGTLPANSALTFTLTCAVTATGSP